VVGARVVVAKRGSVVARESRLRSSIERCQGPGRFGIVFECLV